MGQEMMTTSSNTDNEENTQKMPQDNELDTLSDTNGSLSQCDIPLGKAIDDDDDEVPLLDTFSKEPPLAKINGRRIATTLILCFINFISGIIASGMVVKPSNHQDSGSDQSSDVLSARAFGVLSIASFVSVILVMFCGASSYQNHQQSSALGGLPDMMAYAWIIYGIGVANVLLVVVAFMLLPA